MRGRMNRRGLVEKKRCVCAWLAALVAFPAVALAAEDLRVGISESYPPLAFTKDGAPAGIEVELAPLVGKELGRKVVLVPMKFAALVPALEAGRVDVVMSGLSITDERATKVRFTEPYLRVGQMALIRADDLDRAVDPEGIGAPGARVGVKTGTTGEGWARQNLPKAKIVSFDTVDEGVAALRADQVDYFVHDAPTVWRFTGRSDTRDEDLAGIYRPLTTEYLAWAVQSDDEALAAKLNAALKALRADGRLQEVLDRWIPVTKVAVVTDAPQPTAAPPHAP